MGETIAKMIAALLCATLFCIATRKMLGAMQQAGYKNRAFLGWYTQKGNMQCNRLTVFGFCLVLVSAVTALCFSFLGVVWANVLSAVPFLVLCLTYLLSEEKYALKVQTAPSGRRNRLFAVYFLFTACLAYVVIALLAFLAKLNGSALYACIAFVPFGFFPIVMPFLLCLANAVTSIFENARNKKFVQRAGQVLDESTCIRVGVVGSYGKTSVKNILKTLLEEKYSVIETPLSYNTPIGVAKTVLSEDFAGKEVFIAEMGARKKGDIAELCAMVKPSYGIFTGVCSQHIRTFGDLQSVYEEKSEILRSGAKVICGEGVKALYSGVATACPVEDVLLGATSTSFTLCLGEQKIAVKTTLLGSAAVENIALAATLAFEMGLSAEQIQKGVEKLQPIEHRLQLIESGGAYILDDGYNASEKSAKAAIEALCRFEGGKCIVTPGIVECGILEEQINGKLGEEIAKANLDKVILVGDTLVGAVKSGYLAAGGEASKLTTVKTLDLAKPILGEWLKAGDCVLFLNDLPDVY